MALYIRCVLIVVYSAILTVHSYGKPVYSQEGVKISGSYNVLVDNLEDNTKCNITFYPGKKYQRTSLSRAGGGIGVTILVTNLRAGPEYQDVYHDSDNAYLLNGHAGYDDQAAYHNVHDHLCRDPVPDGYKLKLDEYPDRLTQAQERTCVPKLGCPPGVSDGEKYLERSFGKSCTGHNTTHTDVMVASNVLTCSIDHQLLQELSSEMGEEVWAESLCDIVRQKCDQCGHGAYCLETRWCQLAENVGCSSELHNNCTSGPSHSITLEPVFNMTDHYSCHLKRTSQHFSYNLQVTPILDFLYRFRITGSITSYWPNDGDTDFMFFWLEHLTGGLEYPDEAFLHTKVDGSTLSYGMRGADEPESSPSDSGDSTEGVTMAQIYPPFYYSSSTWNYKDGCYKDWSKIYTSNNLPKHQHQPVSVSVKEPELAGEPFTYAIKPNDGEMPGLRLLMKENASILRYSFAHAQNQDHTPGLVSSSLQSNSSFNATENRWIVNITGTMEAMPAYLNLSISSTKEPFTRARFDILLNYPRTFSLYLDIDTSGALPGDFSIKVGDWYETWDVPLQLPSTKICWDVEDDVVEKLCDIKSYSFCP